MSENSMPMIFLLSMHKINAYIINYISFIIIIKGFLKINSKEKTLKNDVKQSDYTISGSLRLTGRYINFFLITFS